MAWIRYRIPSGAMATMEAPDEDIPTALRALADNGATVLAVSDDFGRELFDAAAIEQLLVDEYDIAALPWNDPMLASERGDIRPDLTDGGYEQLVIDHLRKIHHANPDALNWVKRQLETLFWRVENSSSRVSEQFILEQYESSEARFRPIAVATTVWDVMSLVDEALEWKVPNAPDLVGKVMQMPEDREYRIVRLPRQRPGVDWTDIRPGGQPVNDESAVDITDASRRPDCSRQGRALRPHRLERVGTCLRAWCRRDTRRRQ